MKVKKYSHSKSQILLLIIIYVKIAFAAASGIPPMRLQTDSLKDQLPSLGSRDGSMTTLLSSSGDSSAKPHTQLQIDSSW